MPVDSKMRELLDAYVGLGPWPLERLPPSCARDLPTLAEAQRVVVSQHLRLRARFPLPEPVGQITHRLVSGAGSDLLARIYIPDTAGPLPVLLYLHDGGWVIGGLESDDGSARALANAARCVVVSLAYRKAPEHKFPAAPEDCLAAFQWIRKHAPSFDGDPTRVAVAGEGSGGNLAAALCLMARDRDLPLPVHQLLISPITQHAFDTRSYREHGAAKPLGQEMMFWFWAHYLERSEDGDSPYASPLRARDLAGLPPATVILAEVDPLRSEGEAYADRLRAANVPTRVFLFDGVTHGFFGMTVLLEQARQAVSVAAEELRASFQAPRPTPAPPTGQPYPSVPGHPMA